MLPSRRFTSLTLVCLTALLAFQLTSAAHAAESEKGQAELKETLLTIVFSAETQGEYKPCPS